MFPPAGVGTLCWEGPELLGGPLSFPHRSKGRIARYNTGRPVRFEFWINSKYIFSILHVIRRTYLRQKNIKFKFNGASWGIFLLFKSGNPSKADMICQVLGDLRSFHKVHSVHCLGSSCSFNAFGQRTG